MPAAPAAGGTTLKLRDLANHGNAADDQDGSNALTAPVAHPPHAPDTRLDERIFDGPGSDDAAIRAFANERDLLAVIERGLRAEARRYGLDVDRWGS